MNEVGHAVGGITCPLALTRFKVYLARVSCEKELNSTPVFAGFPCERGFRVPPRVSSPSAAVCSVSGSPPWLPLFARFSRFKGDGQPRDGLPSSSTNFGSFQANAADRRRAVDRSWNATLSRVSRVPLLKISRENCEFTKFWEVKF